MTPDEAQRLVEKAGVKQSPSAYIDYDKTPHPYDKRLISDASFFSLFTDAVVKASDVSNYEGAEIIFNLSGTVPPSLIQGFDFIYNGSVLDNVFDPAACIKNVSRMLKSDAVVFSYEGASHSSPAYLKFTPDWFFDYYAVNEFADFQAYIVAYGDVHADPWSVYEWSAFTKEELPPHLTMPMQLGSDAMVVAIAQNSPAASIERMPLQNIYRDGEHKNYSTAFDRFAVSGRREAFRKIFVQGHAPKAKGRRSLVEMMPRSVRKRLRCETAPTALGHIYLGQLGSPNILKS
jgi:hypothetical protein